MFKALLLLVCFIFLAAGASAGFLLVYPFEQKLLDHDSFDIGSVSAGEVFELIISDESSLGQNVRWQSVFADPLAIPTGWQVHNPVGGEKRLVLKVSVPNDAQPNIYSLSVTAVNEEFGFREDFVARVRVKSSLLEAAVNNPGLNQFPLVGEKVVYSVVLRNDSIAPHPVLVSSTLPKGWFEEMQIVVAPKETAVADFVVVPKVAGKKDFSVTVVSVLSGKEISSFSSSLGVKPTLAGKLSAPKNGLPFFSFGLFPFYFFNSLVLSFFG